MTTSVAIIGEARLGLSAASNLVDRGVTDVTILEATDLAAGSSSYASVGRARYRRARPRSDE
jgi:glycine/D-amino acid oxidase-like deaminating enzyme